MEPENSTNNPETPDNEEKKPSGSDTAVENDTSVDTDNSASNGKETLAKETSTSSNNYDPKNVHYEGDLAIYTDSASGTQYEWCKEKEEWILRATTYEFEGDTHVYTDKDGVKFFFDKEKGAWFPKLDDEFMARYQMNYGFTETKDETLENKKVDKPEDTPKEEEKDESKQAQNKGEKRKASEPTWFELDEKENTKVYVTNLPTDITEQEFIDLMQKCGLVMRDPSTGDFKIKLYKVAGTDILKGDALCTYIRIESVQLALNLLDGYEFKGKTIQVERAKFQMKGQYDPTLKPKMKKRKEKQKLKKIQEKLFDWRPEKPVGEKAKHEKVVVIKNLFEPSIFDTEVSLILEFQEDLREEVSKLGVVRKVIIYDRHPEGVAQINMSSPEEAENVVKLLNGRWFMKRQLSAEIWDGKTKFKIAETDAQINERLDNWDKFLEGKETPDKP